MNRAEEIREKAREIGETKRRYDFRPWCQSYIIPAKKMGWNWIVIAGGDVRDKMNLGFSPLTERRCKVVDIDGIPHTVVEVRNRFIPLLLRAKSLRGFYSMLSSYIADADLRQFHYDLWLAAHNLEAKVARLAELQKREGKGTSETERAVFSHNSIREAAAHYGRL